MPVSGTVLKDRPKYEDSMVYDAVFLNDSTFKDCNTLTFRDKQSKS
jgi:hypothetical protein